MIAYLSDRKLKIEFESYNGVKKEVLLRMVATLKERMEGEEEVDGVKKLKEIMHEGDWETMEAMEALEEGSTMPPVESSTPNVENAGTTSNTGNAETLAVVTEIAEEKHDSTPPSEPPHAQTEDSTFSVLRHVKTTETTGSHERLAENSNCQTREPDAELSGTLEL